MKFFASIALAIVLLTSCNKQPQACISVSQTKVRPDDMITLLSCSEDAERFVWNMGDGTTMEGPSVTHSYAKPGLYQVELKVLSKKDKKWDRATVLMNVAPAPVRYLNRITLNSFNITNPSGQPWDGAPGANPDIFVQFGVEGSAVAQQTPTLQEVSLNMLPLFWDFSSSPSKPILSNATWKIDIRDNDAVQPLAPVSELMGSFSINPATASPNAPNKIILNQSNYQIELEFIEF